MLRSKAVVAVMLVAGLGWSHVAAQVARPAVPQSVPESHLRGFVITLALGDTQGTTSGTFTPAERKALADLDGFLPYKAFRPLDTAYVIGLNGPHLFLRGDDGRKHEFYMDASVDNPSRISVRMLRLWDVAPADSHLSAPALIDTTFRIDVGETVVVGTSRLDGGRAYLLLVTAAPKTEGTAGR